MDIVRFRAGVRNDLIGIADADFQGIGSCVGEHAVVVAFAATESAAVWVEGEAWAEKGVD